MSTLLLSDQHARMLKNGKANAERMASASWISGGSICRFVVRRKPPSIFAIFHSHPVIYELAVPLGIQQYTAARYHVTKMRDTALRVNVLDLLPSLDMAQHGVDIDRRGHLPLAPVPFPVLVGP